MASIEKGPKKVKNYGYNKPTSYDYKALARKYQKEVADATAKYNRLKDLDVFVLDNSIRESTVGQLRGHTLESKWEIYNEVKKCGFKHTIVASFSHMTRVDDIFIKQLVERGEDLDGLWAFSEITDAITNKVPDTEIVPVGLKKLQDVGLYNVIFEIDLGSATFDFNKVSTQEICALVKKWIKWAHKNLHKGKVMVNFRDLPDVMPTDAERVFQVADFLSKSHSELRLFGIIFEEPRGQSLPEECGMWAKFFRKIMNDHKWKGHLLGHVHEKFGYSEATALQLLMDGANGIWASVCLEGASMGNAASAVTLMNLVRLGNKKVLKKYNCAHLRQAAIKVTQITTGQDPHIKQPIYGARALDLVFDLNKEDFDLASFFGEKAPVRMTELTSPEMICIKLVTDFGENADFTIERATEMKEKMLEDLRSNRKEEYMSKVGLALLYDRAGGKLTEEMSNAIANDTLKAPIAESVIKEIRRRWDEWDLQDKVQNDDMLEFNQFYNGFMAPYFACYRCNDTLKAIRALDMDCDGYIDWNEFMVYIKWALTQYGDKIKDADECLEIAFRKGLIPAMRDELLK